MATTLSPSSSWPMKAGSQGKYFLGIALGAGFLLLSYLQGHQDRVWSALLMDSYYALSLSLGAGFLIALWHITSSFWGTPVRRVAEVITSFFPWAAGLVLFVFLAGHQSLYLWTHSVGVDEILQAKSGYLNTNFALVRIILFLAVMGAFLKVFFKSSLAQDQTGDPGITVKITRLSALFLPLFGVGFSFFSYDLVMSLEPHWFSTMYGVYCFAGLFYSTLAMVTLWALRLHKEGVLTIFTQDHAHDLGKMMFAFTVFMAYIGFSQFMLIWYSNMPEETIYYLMRAKGSWYGLYWTLFFLKFVIPFFLLLPREAKRSLSHLRRVAILMLVAHGLDLFILIMPSVLIHHGSDQSLPMAGQPTLSWADLGALLFVGSLFCRHIRVQFSKVPVLAYRDPRLPLALHFHQ